MVGPDERSYFISSTFFLRRGPGPREGCQDYDLQEDGGHLHAQVEDVQRVLQQGKHNATCYAVSNLRYVQNPKKFNVTIR
jgi:hypothetical protein